VTSLATLPRRARIAIALGYAALAALSLAMWWVSLWPNVVADGVVGTPAVVATSGLLVRKVKHEVAAHVANEVKQEVAQHVAAHVETKLAEHRDTLADEIKAHVDRALAATPPDGGGAT
jgi:hypothetical protein